jgi:uncharacterized protein
MPSIFLTGEGSDGESSEAATVRSILVKSGRFYEVLHRCASLDLPGWYLAAGCIAQTVWNHLTGRSLDWGIRDYDLIYFDDSDLSWNAENKIIEKASAVMAGLPITLEVRNQARVHLWYERRFGFPCTPYDSAEAAIRTFPTPATSIGVRVEPTGIWRFCAPFGFTDLLGLLVRPNRVLASREVYLQKSRRWHEYWPELTILPYENGDEG